MTKTQRAAVKALSAVLNRAGVPFRVERRTKHLIVVLMPPGALPYNLSIAGSPPSGVDSGVRMTLHHARRVLNQHGITLPYAP